jgi:hypothetical protein
MEAARRKSGVHLRSIESRPDEAARGSLRIFLFFADFNIEEAIKPA